MKWIFYFEDEGEDGENSFIIDGEDHEEAFDNAYEDYGPQVHQMFYRQLTSED